MKKVLSLLLVFGYLGISALYAATSATVPVQVGVPKQLDLECIVRQVPSNQDGDPLANNDDPWGSGTSEVYNSTTNTSGSGMNFNPLEFNSKYHVWMADHYFVAFLTARTSGDPYTITQSCAGLVNAQGKNLNWSLIMTPEYRPDELIDVDGDSGNAPLVPQGPAGDNDKAGNQTLAVGANKVIYTAPSGFSKVVRCYYGLSTGDTAHEPANAKPLLADTGWGDYSGSITFTVVTN